MPMQTGDEVISIAFAKLTETALEAAGIKTEAQADALIIYILECAEAYHAGNLTLEQIRNLTTAQERFLAARFVRPHPPALAAMFEALTAESGVVFDRCGRAYPEPDGPGFGRRIHYEDGKSVATFTADARLLNRKQPATPKPADRSDLAKRTAWRSGMSAGDRD